MGVTGNVFINNGLGMHLGRGTSNHEWEIRADGEDLAFLENDDSDKRYMTLRDDSELDVDADLNLDGTFDNFYYSQRTGNQDFTSGYGNIRQVDNVRVESGQRVLLMAMVSWDHDDNEWVRFRFYRGGTQIGEDMEVEEDDNSGGYADNSVTHLMWVDTPSAGTYDYSIRVDSDDNTVTRVYNVSIVAIPL
jgi:hypothetical protein